MCNKCGIEKGTENSNTKDPQAKEDFRDEMAKIIFGRSIKDKPCVICGSERTDPTDFRDDLSRKEFGISHLCQECQDLVFDK